MLSVCMVDRNTDLGEGKHLAGDLRYCLEQALDGDRIQFAVEGTITLASALPSLTRSISIEGPGPNLLIIDGNRWTTVFRVARDATIDLSGLSITNGSECGGGGIANVGTLTLSNSTISRNSGASDCGGQGGYGGGITNGGTLIVINSTVSGNSAWNWDGAGGGISNGGTLFLQNTTVSGNVAQDGGGVYNSGAMTILNSTLTNNEARPGCFPPKFCPGNGGGIYGGGTLVMRNTILAGNFATIHSDISGHLTSSGYNLIGNTQGGTGYERTDLLDVDPLLGPLQDNGGWTRTHALSPGSPALDAGDNTGAPPTDQRGRARVVHGDIDIGAYERQRSLPPLRAEAVFAGRPGFGPGAASGATCAAWMAADLIEALTGRRLRPDSLVAALAEE